VAALAISMTDEVVKIYALDTWRAAAYRIDEER